MSSYSFGFVAQVLLTVVISGVLNPLVKRLMYVVSSLLRTLALSLLLLLLLLLRRASLQPMF